MNLKNVFFILLSIVMLGSCNTTKKSKTPKPGEEGDYSGFKKMPTVDNTVEVVVLPGDLQSIDEYVTREKGFKTGIDQKMDNNQITYFVKGKQGNKIITGVKSQNDTLKEETQYFYRDGKLVYAEGSRKTDKTSFWNIIKKYYFVDDHVKQGLVRKIDTRLVTFGKPSTEPFINYAEAQMQEARLISGAKEILDKYDITPPYTGRLQMVDNKFTLNSCLSNKVINVDDFKGVAKKLWSEKTPSEGQFIYVVLDGIYNSASNTLVPSGFRVADLQGATYDCLK